MKKKEKKKSPTISVESNAYERIMKVAKSVKAKTGMTMSHFFTLAIEQYIAEYQQSAR